jgi:hypothetical protein
MKKRITLLLMAAICSTAMFADVTWWWTNNYWNWYDAGNPGYTQIYAQLHSNGVTTVAAGSDHASKISFQIGVSTTSGGPYTWIQDDATQPSGSNNWAYQPHLNGVPTGTFYYTFRAKDLVSGQVSYFQCNDGTGEGSMTVPAWTGQDVTWTNVQSGSNNPNSIASGASYPVGVDAYSQSITAANPNTQNALNTITCDFGYSSSSTDPADASFTWTSVSYTSGTNNWSYTGSVAGIPDGTYTGVYRLRVNGQAYVYTTTTSFTVGATSGVGATSSVSTVSLVNSRVKDGVLKVTLPEASGSYKLSVYDLAGRLLQTEKVSKNAGVYSLLLQSVGKGLNVLQVVSSDNQKKTLKFILD